MKAPKFINGAPDAKENERFYRELADTLTSVSARVAESQESSTATSVEELKTDLNALIAKLKASGQMEA